MAKLKDISIRGKDFELYYQVGTVLKESKRSETKVSGGGGSISTINGNTSGSVSDVVSNTTVYDDIIIADKTGKEHSYQFSDYDLICREGNELGIVWVIKKGQEKGSYVMVINNSTNKKFFDKSAIATIFRATDSGGLGCVLLIGFLLCVILSYMLLPWYVPVLLLSGGGIWQIKEWRQQQIEFSQFNTELTNIQFSSLK